MPTQLSELKLEQLQFRDAIGYEADVLVEQRVHLAAALLRRIATPEEAADLAERHVQRTTVPDERQPIEVSLSVEPEISPRPAGGGQQSLALVEPDRFDAALESFR
jgi:hypothetical protein